MTLRGKRMLVTGGSSGIGLEIARAALSHGARVVISGRRGDRVEETITLLGASGEAHGVAADVTTAAGRRAMLDAVLGQFGGLDILVNNAGGVRAGRLERLDEDAIEAMVAVNLTAPVYLTQAALPALRKSGAALIVNVSSGIAQVGLPFYSVYAAVKAGIARFGESLRRELDGEGIRVLTVYPTATETPMMATSGMKPPGGRESAADVAQETIDAIINDRLEVVRGDEERLKMVQLNKWAPAAVDTVLKPMKAALEEAARYHVAL